MRSAMVTASCLLALGCAAPAALPTACEDDADAGVHPRAAAFQARLDQATREGAVGLSLLVQDGDGTWSGTSGLADLAGAAPLRRCSRTPVFSVTKLLAAVLTLDLVEQGALGLDDPLSSRLEPAVLAGIPNAGVATLRQLLGHTSGIPEYADDALQLRFLDEPGRSLTSLEALDLVRGASPWFPPGTRFAYSNTNYVLLGLVVERASGLPFGQRLHQRLLDPLGMRRSSYDEPVTEGAVQGYADFAGDGVLRRTTDFSHPRHTPDGALIATADDLGRFARALFGGQLLSPASLEAMQAWHDNPQVAGARYGLGLEFHAGTPHGDAIGHTGGSLRGAATLSYFPATSALLVLVSNAAGRGRPDAAYRALLEELSAQLAP